MPHESCRVKPAYYFCIFWFFWKKTQAKCPAMKRFVELSLLMVYYIEHFQLFSAADFKYFSKSIFGRCSGEKLILNTVKRVYKWQNHWVEISSELTKISVKLTAAVFNDTIFFRLYSVVYKRHNITRKRSIFSVSSWMLLNDYFLFTGPT